MNINFLVIDLSHWDEASDYSKVKAAGIAGVIYKATQGSGNVDTTYSGQRASALKNGLLWGAYHFGDGSSVKTQAQNFLNHADVTAGDLFCLDYENNADSQMSIQQAIDWTTQVENDLGRVNQCVLYSGNLIKETMRPQDQPFWGSRRLWLAQYASKPVVPAPWAKYWLWQYTDGESGPSPHSVAGVSGTIDCNHYDGTADQLKAEWATGKSQSPIPVEPVRICPLCHQPWPIPA
jgi:lysozyme